MLEPESKKTVNNILHFCAGAAIIRMIANFYEPYEDFRTTIRFYLKTR